MSGKKSGKKTRELKIVFDSNAIYTVTASELLKKEVAQLIQENSSHPDLKTTWLLPEIVILERQYQMQKMGLELLPSVQKLEKLLAHNLNITDVTIRKSVKDVIEEQLKKFNINTISLETDKVDWKKIINDAAFRNPPFEAGKKEKGFRDAIIAEAFTQMISRSPKTPDICRVVMVTSDELLGVSIENKIVGCQNVKVFKDIDELKGLINTLVSQVTEEYVESLKEKAGKYFFVEKDKTTLFYKENIREQIKGKYESELKELPEGADTRENGTWYISPPRFDRKVGQRVFWYTQFRVEAEAFKSVGVTTTELSQSMGLTNLSGVYAGMSEIAGLAAIPQETKVSRAKALSNTLASLYSPPLEKSLVSKGKTFFEIIWSVSVNRHKALIKPKIEDILYKGTSWE